MAMTRNRIQFQKGLSEAQFVHLYGDEAKCRALVTAWRWHDGFRCPRCKGSAHCLVSERRLFQCNSCHHQASPTAGTIFDSTKLPLTVWFRGWRPEFFAL
jgi:ribosomal protein L37AE/L43A